MDKVGTPRGVTFKEAVAANPVKLSLAVTAPVVFTYLAALELVTSMLKVHDAPGASVAPINDTEDPPAVAAIVPPPQEPANPFGVLTITPVGRLSVNPAPVSAISELGFVRVNLSALVLCVPMVDGVNDAEIVGAAGGEGT